MFGLSTIQQMNSEIAAAKSAKLARLTNGVDGGHPKDGEKGRKVSKAELNEIARRHKREQPQPKAIGLGASIY